VEIREASLPDELLVLRQMMNAYLVEFDPESDPATYWDDGYFAACQEGASRGAIQILFAVDAAVPVAFIIGRIEDLWYRPSLKLGHIEEIYVVPTYRRRGLAKSLLSRLKLQFRDRDVATMTALVHCLNPSALLFWLPIGFEIQAYHLFAPL